MSGAVLLSGAAGFIGMHVAEALLDRGERVIGIDNMNRYYDPGLKEARCARLEKRPGFTFRRLDVADRAGLHALVEEERGIDRIVHLAAQAGVRHSMVDPYAYVQANVMGHLVVQEAARRLPGLRHLVYASSSSVYGANRQLPFSETDRVDAPVSLYAATKRADELMSYAYAHLFGLPQTGLRFFTVYGPWGRPDMAYYSFARAIAAGEPITVYEGGRLKRDFTYIDDIVAGVLGALDRPPDDRIARPRPQHRQSSGRGGRHAGPTARAGAWPAGGDPRRAAARGRRGGDLRRRAGDFGPDGVRAPDPPGRGDCPVRGLVPRLSRRALKKAPDKEGLTVRRPRPRYLLTARRTTCFAVAAPIRSLPPVKRWRGSTGTDGTRERCLDPCLFIDNCIWMEGIRRWRPAGW